MQLQQYMIAQVLLVNGQAQCAYAHAVILQGVQYGFRRDGLVALHFKIPNKNMAAQQQNAEHRRAGKQHIPLAKAAQKTGHAALASHSDRAGHRRRCLL